MTKTGRWKAPALALALVFVASSAPAGTSTAVIDPAICGDVNANGKLTSSDALAVLKAAVGQPQELYCESAPATADYGYKFDLPETSNFTLNYLLGTRVNVPLDVTVTNLGIVSTAAGSRVKMALYTDLGGSPNLLVASSHPANVIEGRQAVDVPATLVTAGDYWVMAVFDVTTPLPADEESNSNAIRYRPQNFGDDMPLVFGEAQGYLGSPMHHYVKAVF